MKKILISWVGKHDLNAREQGRLGPVLAAINDACHSGHSYDAVHLLCNYPKEALAEYLSWLKESVGSCVLLTGAEIELTSPTAYGEIYSSAHDQLACLSRKYPDYQRVVHLSPGTPAMAAIWVLLVKTQYPSICIESWVDNHGGQHVKKTELPFHIAAEFSANAYKEASLKLEHAENDVPALGGVIGECHQMRLIMKKAEKMALHDVPVLILGETGTGKEVFAKAIHDVSRRSGSPFVAVNCGALPEEIAESLLFGHKKGAFTGAYQDHHGYFSQANGGVLFLDEIGELSPLLQTKLLRVLQEKEFTPVGSKETIRSDFRLIAATHRNLSEMIYAGSFRQDLFYRITIGILKIPPLRERVGDIRIMADELLKEINEELADQPAYQSKEFVESAFHYMERQSWPGNVRELRACILRAAIWSDSHIISAADLSSSILDQHNYSIIPKTQGSTMHKIDLTEVIKGVASEHIQSALKATQGNKAAAARILGLNSPQVLSNWIKKYAIE